MREYVVASKILSAVLRKVDAERLSRVDEVYGWISDCEPLNFRLLQDEFHAYARGTRAQDAELLMHLMRAAAECGACGRGYQPSVPFLCCPFCQSVEGCWTTEPGMAVEEIVGDDNCETMLRSATYARSGRDTEPALKLSP